MGHDFGDMRSVLSDIMKDAPEDMQRFALLSKDEKISEIVQDCNDEEDPEGMAALPCDVCHGKRYNYDTLEVKYKGKSIFDVLDMTVEEGLHFFDGLPRLTNKLQTLYDVGLGYIKIGQASTTLSGGEAQRVKLSTELSRRSTGKTVYILDEPTTGLHSYDVHRLTEVLQKLVDEGNTVIVIEHNMDVIKSADHIIDLGPEGGDSGGEIVCTGTPEEVAENEKSWTGKFLKKYLKHE